MDSVIVNAIIKEIGLAIVGIIAIIFVALRKKIAQHIIKFIEHFWKLKIYKQLHYMRSDVERDVRIQDILAELRITCNSDRAYILQFHNGSVFSAKNQMWRLSCTHESTSPGVRPSIGEVQNILSSSISDILHPLWNDDLQSMPGITKVSPAVCGCANKTGCRLPKGVWLFSVDQLAEGYSKGVLNSRAIKYTLRSPILDEQTNQIGILCLDYCWNDANINEISNCAEALCHAASTVSFELRKRH